MQRRAHGFTLVELLLAVTLLATLLALAYSGLRAATKASERGQAMLADSGRMRITHQFIRKQLNLMLPLAYRSDEEDTRLRYVFEGSPDRIVFVGPMPGYLARGGPQVQVLEFTDGAQGKSLQFLHAPLLGFEMERLLDREPVVLFDNLAAGRFEFLTMDEEAELPEWVSEWEFPGELPESVSLQLAFSAASASRWPPLVAGTKLDPQLAVSGSTVPAANYADAIRNLMRGSNKRSEE